MESDNINKQTETDERKVNNSKNDKFTTCIDFNQKSILLQIQKYVEQNSPD
ncbi:MAG: hypothetical protein PV340_02275 [Wolbachia sp.]|nr:hypothetical protein [Wolbachia sp.]MDD9336580.1 hypothetical protein [Wolbachia sp.]